jgi:hypothetical protein
MFQMVVSIANHIPSEIHHISIATSNHITPNIINTLNIINNTNIILPIRFDIFFVYFSSDWVEFCSILAFTLWVNRFIKIQIHIKIIQARKSFQIIFNQFCDI